MVKIDRQPAFLLTTPCVPYVLEQALFGGEKPLGETTTTKNVTLKRLVGFRRLNQFRCGDDTEKPEDQ